jgi:hypothetical protein
MEQSNPGKRRKYKVELYFESEYSRLELENAVMRVIEDDLPEHTECVDVSVELG